MKKLLIALIAITLFSCTKEMKPLSQERGKPIKEVTLSSGDLIFTLSGTTFTTTISPNANWAGIQKYQVLWDINGAVSVDNWYFSSPPGNITKSVESIGSGFYRSWTSDFDQTVHYSNVIQIQ